VALVLTINSVDVTAYLQSGTLTVTTKDTVFDGRADFVMVGFTPGWNQSVDISDGSVNYFVGHVAAMQVIEYTPGEWFCRVSCNDVRSWTPGPAPFSLSDRDADTTYVDIMSNHTGSETNVWEPYEWWRLGESSGTTASGEKGVRDGTYVNTPTLGVTGALANISDTAVTFTRTSTEYVNCGNALIAGNVDIAMSAWVKFTDKSATNIIYCERAVGSTRYLRLYTNSSGYACFDYRTSSSAVVAAGTVDLSDGEWHHIVGTKLATAMEVYVDGALAGSGTKLGNDTFLGTEVARIGYDPEAGTLMNGTIDEVAIWPHYIDSTMVAQLYATRDIRSYVSLRTDYFTDAGSKKTIVVDTFDDGLATAQTLCVTSENSKLVGYAYTIQELGVTFPKDGTARYSATVGSVPPRLAAAFP
jgi:hypothetical protein